MSDILIETKLVKDQQMNEEMNEQVNRAKESYFRWLDSFNRGDFAGMLDEMHFPHLRISGNNELQIWESLEDHELHLRGTSNRLIDENWKKTVSEDVTAVQCGSNKVHLAMKQYRVNTMNQSYNIFDTLWIFIFENGRWGVKFRSSYLSA